VIGLLALVGGAYVLSEHLEVGRVTVYDNDPVGTDD
jgi:hypothetical protein